MNLFRFMVVSACVALTVCRVPAEPAEAGARQEAWRMNVIPYYWAPNIEADLRLGDKRGHIRQNFLEKSGEFKPHVVGLAFGTVRRHWGFLAEAETFSSDFSFALPDGRSATAEFEGQHLGLGLLYQGHWTPYKGSAVYLTPWLGLSYRHAGLRFLDDEPMAGEKRSDRLLAREDSHWVEPLAGARIQWFVTPEWSLSASGSTDGWLQDQTTWSTSAWLKYHTRHEFSLAAGYRYEDFDYLQDGGREPWGAEGSMHGVIVGIELDFFAIPSSKGEAWDHLPGALPPAQRPDDKEVAIPAGEIAEKPEDLQGQPTNLVAKAMDTGHAFLHQKLEAGVEAIDTWALNATQPLVPREKSRFFFSLDMRYTDEAEGDNTLDFRPTVDAKIDLPNLEQRLKLAIGTSAVDEKPGTDTFDREQSFNMGLESADIFSSKTKLKVGVRSSLDAYVSASWKPRIKHKAWSLSPELRAFYRTDKQEGAVASLGLNYALKDRLRMGWLSALEAGHESDWRVSWLQNLSCVYLCEGTDEVHHRAFFSRLSVKGRWSGETESYRWTPLSYRAPLYRQWLYWELGPEMLWRAVDQWELETAIRFTVSSLFWGTHER